MTRTFKGEITFRTHSVVVESMEDKLYCFKHNDKMCEMVVFSDYEEMIEWVLEPFPSLQFGLVLDDRSTDV